MAYKIYIKIDGNFLIVIDDPSGIVKNFPLKFTSYEVLIPQQLDADSTDNKTYLSLITLDGSGKKYGEWDILSEGCNYQIESIDLETIFEDLPTLTSYLNSILCPISI